MRYPYTKPEEPIINTETASQSDPSRSGSFYRSLARSAEEAGHPELAQRLTNFSLDLVGDPTNLQDPDWVFWDRRDLYPNKKQFISPGSELYKRDRKEVREEMNTLMGYRDLDRDIVDRVASRPDRRARLLAECSEDIEKAREDWLGILGDEKISDWVRGGIADELEKQGYYTWPEEFDWQSRQCVADLNAQCILAIRGLSTTEFYDFIEQHMATYRVEAQEMAERFVEYERDFRQKLNEYISNRTIPMPREKAIERVEQVRIYPLDRITRRASGCSGMFGFDTTDVYIVSGQDPKTERQVYFHERLHAISGRTVFFDPSYEGRALAIQRVGLEVWQQSNPDTEIRFRWLDEAVTEELANVMSGFDTGTYSEEIAIKNLLLRGSNHNIPEKLLIDAYFEDFEPDAIEKNPHGRDSIMQ